MIVHLTGADFKAMPWTNGRGTTLELLRIERAGCLILRLSRALVVEDGPFSLFPGIERNLTVLSGPGFSLLGEGLQCQALPLQPVGFSGDILVQAAGVTAPSEDFNVMSARSLKHPQVWVQQAGQVAEDCAILALATGRIGGLSVAQYDLVVTDQPLRHDMTVIAVRSAELFSPR